MRTDALIRLLATQAGPAPRGVVWRRLAPVAVLGLASSMLLALMAQAMVPTDLLTHPLWWLKWSYAAALAAGAAWLTGRLARPAAADTQPRLVLALTLGAMALLGSADWLLAERAQRLPQLMGHSWATCSRNVLLLSLLPMAGCFWALRGLAPTQPRRAGAAAGLCAGALAAMGYALICEETAPSFVAVWYTLGIAGASLLGAWLGPRLLRW
jgi:hypothetical protein